MIAAYSTGGLASHVGWLGLTFDDEQPLDPVLLSSDELGELLNSRNDYHDDSMINIVSSIIIMMIICLHCGMKTTYYVLSIHTALSWIHC